MLVFMLRGRYQETGRVVFQQMVVTASVRQLVVTAIVRQSAWVQASLAQTAELTLHKISRREACTHPDCHRVRLELVALYKRDARPCR